MSRYVVDVGCLWKHVCQSL